MGIMNHSPCFNIQEAMKRANEEYEASRERFKKKRVELQGMLRREETDFELIKPKNRKTGESPSDYEILFDKQDGLCALCKLPFGKSKGTIDHIIPKSKGGTNKTSNKQLTHSWCNNVKADSEEILTPTEYMDLANERRERVLKKRKQKSQLEKSYLNHQIINQP